MAGVALGFIAVGGCAEDGRDRSEPSPIPESSTTAQEAQGDFWSRLSTLCGRAFPGVAVEFPEADAWLDGAELVMHAWECNDERMKIAFNVGDDLSRTWILTRHEGAIELRHDHRHQDGSPGDPTMYGAITHSQGSAERQEFPRETDEGLVGGWAIEIVPGERYTYGTVRDDTWRHRLDFDLTGAAPIPPPSWGQSPPTSHD